MESSSQQHPIAPNCAWGAIIDTDGRANARETLPAKEKQSVGGQSIAADRQSKATEQATAAEGTTGRNCSGKTIGQDRFVQDSRRNLDRIPTPGTSNLGANRQDLAELKTGTSASFASVAPINPTLNPNNRNPGSVSFNQDFSRSGSDFSRINPTSASLASVAPNNFNVNPIPTNPTPASISFNQDFSRTALRQQFTDVSQLLNSLRGLSGQPVVAEANRILASQQAEIAARNAFLAPRSNDPQVAGTLRNLAAADQNLTGALTRLRDVANDPQAVQQQLKQVNALRQPVAQCTNHMFLPWN
ncbi:hypothetical protein PCASD_20501 [Puccinia coronata f. sp. avenae]|uniref:Uncharacterized protein n=1 Tax=Puccinia coronata f. sp. avenae TaxID=200324 RepID=A0A2N5SS56_9BASI|nr:hypothetical protein PCASD_20501 [Puccinia coronata f. sp. avenae]